MVTKTQYVRFTLPLSLDSGAELKEFSIAYECYGSLNSSGTNAILVCHGLTSDAHAAGKHWTENQESQKAGWWDALIGPGRTLDTEQYFIISSNVIGGSGGSTGPSSINAETGRAYGMEFPIVTIADMVRAQQRLLLHLGISHLYCVIGGCMGGFQVLEWARKYPDMVDRAIAIGATPSASAYTIALWYVMRRAIMNDPLWRGGGYYENELPATGLGLSTQIGILLWMNYETMARKFGRKLTQKDYSYSFEADFAVEDFLRQIELSMQARIDPNSLLYLMRAMTYFDLAHGFASLAEALAAVHSDVLLISYRQDWRYPSAEVETIRTALQTNNTFAEHAILESTVGHGAFLYDPMTLVPVVSDFLKCRPQRQENNTNQPTLKGPSDVHRVGTVLRTS